MCKTLVLSSEYIIRTFQLAAFSLFPQEEKVRTPEMAVDSPAGVIIIAAVLLLAATTLACGSDAVLKLERLIPPNHELGLTELRAFDSARHGRLLQSPVGGVVNFPVDGASDPFLVGYYYCCYPFPYAFFRFRFSNFSFYFLVSKVQNRIFTFFEPWNCLWTWI